MAEVVTKVAKTLSRGDSVVENGKISGVVSGFLPSCDRNHVHIETKHGSRWCYDRDQPVTVVVKA